MFDMRQITILVAAIVAASVCLAEPVRLPKPGKIKRFEIFEQVAYEKLNDIREKLGLPRLAWNERLAKAARAHSMFMATNRTIGHAELKSMARFYGATPQDRFRKAGYKNVAIGESLAAVSFDGARFITEGLIDAPYHRMTLLDPKYTDVGIAVVCRGISQGSWLAAECYATFDFGGDAPDRFVVFPCNSVTVRTFFDCSETPNPCANLGAGVERTGYIFTFHNPPEWFGISGQGGRIITDENDINRDQSDSRYIMFIPEKTLKPRSKYSIATDDGTCEFTTYRATGFSHWFEPRKLEAKEGVDYTVKLRLFGKGIYGFARKRIELKYTGEPCRFTAYITPSFESDDIYYLHFELQSKGGCSSIRLGLEVDMPVPQSRFIWYEIDAD